MNEDPSTQQFSSTSHAQQVVGAISHDFRGPTRQIKSFLQLLDGHLGERVDDEAREYIDLIGSAVDALEAKIEAIGRLSQVAEANLVLSECDLGDLVRSARAQLGNQQGVVEVEASARVFSDPELLVTLFVELIDNAIKFCAPPVNIQVECALDEGGLLVTLSDSGPGFAAQSHNEAFNLFRRFHLEDYPGTGTGLAVVRSILERHQSRPTIESDPATGTTVRFTLPLSAGLD